MEHLASAKRVGSANLMERLGRRFGAPSARKTRLIGRIIGSSNSLRDGCKFRTARGVHARSSRGRSTTVLIGGRRGSVAVLPPAASLDEAR